MNPRAQTVGGQSFPRDTLVRYRGSASGSPQFNVTSVVQAFLGDPQSQLGSLAHFRITQRLTGADSNNGKIEGRVLSMIAPQLSALLACNGGEPYTLREARRYADDLLEKYFNQLRSENKVISTYVDQGSPGRIDWPAELVFSSVYPYASGIYGGKSAIIKEQKTRSIELDFWNFAQGRIWSPGADKGEFVSPGYIPASDIIGIITKTTDSYLWQGGLESNTEMKDAIVRFDWKGKSYGLVLDVEGQNCISPDPQAAPVFCQDRFNITPTVLSPLPLPLNELVPVMGVILPCSDGSECHTPTELRALFTAISAKSPRGELLSEIKAAKFGPLSAVFEKWTPKPPKTITIIEATFGGNITGVKPGNVTKAASDFCNGKTECRYKVSPDFIGDPAPGQDKDFRISWKCSDEIPRTKQAVANAVGAVLALDCK